MQITQEHFGVIYSGYPADEDFYLILSYLGGSMSRYPGGALAELHLNIYDVGRDTIFDPGYLFIGDSTRNRTSFSEFLSPKADEVVLHVIMPTLRYKSDIEKALSDSESLAFKIAETGTTSVRVELGNEYYSLDGLTAAEYGRIVEDLVWKFAEIDEAHPNLDFEILVQLGKTIDDNEAIFGSLSADAGMLIDGLILHSMPINMNNLYANSPSREAGFDSRFDLTQSMWDAWQNRFAIDYDLHMTGWAVGAPALKADEVDLAYQDYGARGGILTLANFVEATSLGVSSASIWGVGVANLNTLGYVDDGEVILSPAGLMFSELQNSVVGYQLHGGEGDLRTFGDAPDETVISFVAPGQAVLYIIPSSEGAANVLTLNLPQYLPEDATEVFVDSVTRISAAYPASYIPTGVEEDRLHERAFLLEIDDFVFDGQRISFEFASSFDVTEVSLSWLTAGTPEDDVFIGTQGVNRMQAMAGDDFLEGGDADDCLSGGVGNDLILGGGGADLLIGDDTDFSIFDWS